MFEYSIKEIKIKVSSVEHSSHVGFGSEKEKWNVHGRFFVVLKRFDIKRTSWEGKQNRYLNS